MNAVYKLIFNISTGTWAVAHELATARGKKSRTRLATAMAVALAIPAGAALAADAPLQCDVNETVSADGLRCEAAASTMSTMGGGIGTMATATELNNLIKFGSSGGAATASGNDAIAIGAGAVTSANDSVVMGSQVRNGSVNTFVWGENYVEVDAASAGSFVISPTGGTAGAYKKALVNSANTAAILGTAENAPNSVAIGFNAKTAGTSTSLATGAVAIGDTSSASAAGAVALGSNSIADTANTVSVGNATLQRKIVNMADGALSATSKEAVNGSQLFATNEAVAQNAADITSTNTALTTLDGRVTINEDDIANLRTDVTSVQGDVTNLNTSVTNLDGRMNTAETNITDLQSQIGNGSIGLVQQDAISKVITVAGDKEGTEVSFAGTDAVTGAAIDRTLSGVARGSADNDAANIGQVKDVLAGLGGGATVNADGSITAPTYSIDGTDFDNVGDAFTAVDSSLTSLDGRMTVNEGNISNLTQQFNDLNDGTAGIVTYDDVAGSVNVAADKAGTVVNVAGTAGNRTIAGVADGTVDATSDEAVNGSQLHATNERVTANETNIANLDGRMTVNEGDISNLTQQFNDLSSGSAGMVTHDAATGAINVGANVGGDVVNLAGTDGARRLAGIANGTEDSDAVTLAQLKASGLVDPNDGRALGALVYDDMSLDRATLGGLNGTVIANLGNGLIAAGSREAVNGGQLWQMNADWEAKWNAMDGRVGTIEQDIANGNIGGPGGGTPGTGNDWRGAGDHSVAIGDGSNAGGTGSIGIGNGSDASGSGSIAIGDGASASGDNSVAIGAGSTADRDNEYSVGSDGNERVVSNVGRGTRATDAVNLGQMEDRFAAERDWANGRFQAVDKRMDRMGAMNAAMVNMAVSAAGVHTTNRVGAGVGFQNGKSALSVGYQRALSERATITLGGSFSGSEASAGFGAGFGW